jgi:hypothetical protein
VVNSWQRFEGTVSEDEVSRPSEASVTVYQGRNIPESLVTLAERMHKIKITMFDLDYFSAG